MDDAKLRAWVEATTAAVAHLLTVHEHSKCPSVIAPRISAEHLVGVMAASKAVLAVPPPLVDLVVAEVRAWMPKAPKWVRAAVVQPSGLQVLLIGKGKGSDPWNDARRQQERLSKRLERAVMCSRFEELPGSATGWIYIGRTK